MKIWIDDIRRAPKGWVWIKTVDEALITINTCSLDDEEIIISLDHDASDKYTKYGGDYIEILNRLEAECAINDTLKEFVKTKMTFNLHSMNPVGVENMRRIIRKNGWEEV